MISETNQNSKLNKYFQIKKYYYPFNFAIIYDFLDLDYLKKLENIIDNLPEPIFIKESNDFKDISVPHSVIRSIDSTKLNEGDNISLICNTNSHSDNKEVKDCKEATVFLSKVPQGRQALNRTFIDLNNIVNYKEIVQLKDILCSKFFVKLLEDTLNIELKDSRLRIELLRNKSDHWIGPHLDCKEKLVSLLLYINFNNQPIMSGTDLYIKKNNNYDWKDNKKLLDSNKVYDDFEKVDTAPFINNSCFLFCLNKDAWHGRDQQSSSLSKDRKLIQINYVNMEYSTYNDCFPLDE